MSDLEERLARIEARLAALETIVRGTVASPRTAPAPAPSPLPKLANTVAGMPALRTPPAPAPTRPALSTPTVTTVLGWGGAAALVLAASYLIRLAYDAGWLTPIRQVAFATIFGVSLIVAGFPLRALNRRYAGYLPAGGVAVLFLTTYGAHLYYDFIDARAALVAVVSVCLLALWLCRTFASDLYALFAVAGSYSAPILLHDASGSVTDLVIYFSAWSVVFSMFSIWQGRRMIYLLALYLALIGFDIAWFSTTRAEWVAALVFQTAQFAIFGVATVQYSIRHEEPLSQEMALAHLPPMLLFYFLQYALLDKHLHSLAPWIAAGSAAGIALLYMIARRVLQRPLPGGEFLVWAYAALVAFHAGYIEALPEDWAPWAAVVVMAGAAIAAVRLGGRSGMTRQWPLWVVVGLVLAVNYLRVAFALDLNRVPAHQLLGVVYALELYVAYHFLRGTAGSSAAGALLYAGHVSAMGAGIRLLDEPIVQSTTWGLLALVCLGVALRRKDRLVGQSSLLLFGAAAGKVLLFDLQDAAPLWRIASLVVLGLTFYAGGLLYQRMLGAAATPARGAAP